MKRFLVISGITILIGLAAAAGFWGGIQYQTSQAEQVRTDFFNARGQIDNGQLTNQMPMSGENQRPDRLPPSGFGSGTSGIIKTIEGNTLTISTAQDVTTVKLSDNLKISKSQTGTMDDLQTGVRINIIGQSDSDGTILANEITIMDGVDNVISGTTVSGTEP